MDRYIHVLTKLPGVTENIARKLIDLGITDIPAARKADKAALQKAGLKVADINKIHGGERKHD